jgi:exonuclease SbcC
VIRRLELVNFMSHGRTVIEPADGLTVLVGPNNCGKSAVVAAMQILCHNETSTYVMRHGERECSVTVETAEGKVVQWRRRKSPAYFVDGAELSRLERSEVPDEVVRALRLAKVSSDGAREFNVHFGEQKSPVFLLDQSGSHAAQFFASSSDAASLVEMQRLHQQKISEARKERIKLDAEAARLATDLAILVEADPIGISIQEAEARHAAIERLAVAATRITDDVRSVSQASGRLSQLDMEVAAVAGVCPPPSLESTEPLMQLVVQLRRANADQMRQDSLADALSLISPSPVLPDERSLHQIVRSLSVALNDYNRLEAECEMNRTLLALPQLADDDSLRTLADKLATAQLRVMNMQRRAIVLESLASTPELRSEATVMHDLDMLRHACASASRTEAAYQELEHLAAPAQLEHATELATLLTQIAQSCAILSTQEQQVGLVADRLQVVEADLCRWAQDNRVCPTCGGALDPLRIAEHARMHGGGAHA